MERLETFLGDSGLGPNDRELAWTLLAHALRAAGARESLVRMVPRETKFRELMQPFLHFFDAAGARGEEVVTLLERKLRGRELSFPFGVIAVDPQGFILRLSTQDESVDRRQMLSR